MPTEVSYFLPATRRCSPAAARLRSSPDPRQASGGEDRRGRLWMLRDVAASSPQALAGEVLLPKRSWRSRRSDRSACRARREQSPRARSEGRDQKGRALRSEHEGTLIARTERGATAEASKGRNVQSAFSSSTTLQGALVCLPGNGFRESGDGAKPHFDSHTLRTSVRR
jgi:hypothetical protein